MRKASWKTGVNRARNVKYIVEPVLSAPSSLVLGWEVPVTKKEGAPSLCYRKKPIGVG